MCAYSDRLYRFFHKLSAPRTSLLQFDSTVSYPLRGAKVRIDDCKVVAAILDRGQAAVPAGIAIAVTIVTTTTHLTA